MALWLCHMEQTGAGEHYAAQAHITQCHAKRTIVSRGGVVVARYIMTRGAGK